MLTPTNILIDGDYWPEASAEERSAVYEGNVVALIKDSEGTMYCAFEMPDQLGLQLISLGSRFFKGFTGEPPFPDIRDRVHYDEHVSLPITREKMIEINKKIGEDIRQKIYGFRPSK